ncbi:MAG: 16S rRNA (guanine(527)-N(7))-methyltransferase RsmG [Candidatus Obscuribacter sp.]|nr:16S rRNA (guanine(527)-N(7))-methyltransferase RsmG [Candidatus Melainabacteria bacterium]MDX1985349.1 16S rRNA (guanine(527)-N(7))-methyltransferase RsmG [Candidatus Obscuribacter sp.]
MKSNSESTENRPTELSALTEKVAKQAELAELPIEAQACQKIADFVDFLWDYNRRVNLVGTKDIEQIIEKHVLDAFTVARAFQKSAGAKSYVDLGCGGGLPGMLVALVNPALEVTLVDAIGKKCRFLEEATDKLCRGYRPPVRIICARAEELFRQPDFREHFDLGTARAVGPLKLTMELVAPALKPGGFYLAQKTLMREEEERQEAALLQEKLALKLVDRQTFETLPSIKDNVLLTFCKEKPTSAQYPREWKKIKGES